MKIIISLVSVSTLILLTVGISLFATKAIAAGDESIRNDDEMRRLVRQHFASSDWAALDQMGNQLVRAYEKDPNQFAALRTFFFVLPNSRSSSSALESYNSWVSRFPNSYTALYARARYSAYLAMDARGGEFIEKVSADQIEQMKVYFALCQEDLARSLKYSTRPSMTYLQLVRIARYSGTSKEARQYYEKSTEFDPDILIIAEQFLFSLQPRWGGSFKALQRFPEEARKLGLSASKADALKLEARWLEAKDYVLYEKKKQAKQLLTTIANDPSDDEHNASALIELADMAKADRDLESAMRYYQQGLNRKPDHVRLLVGLAATMRDLKRSQEALALYDRAIATAPNDKWALAGRGWLHHNLKNDTAALPDVLKAAKLGDPTSQSILGYIYWQGEVVKRDQIEALHWWNQSAKQKHKIAEESLQYAKEHLGANYNEMLARANSIKRSE